MPFFLQRAPLARHWILARQWSLLPRGLNHPPRQSVSFLRYKTAGEIVVTVGVSKRLHFAQYLHWGAHRDDQHRVFDTVPYWLKPQDFAFDNQSWPAFDSLNAATQPVENLVYLKPR